jgi:hypothetical protein
MTAAALLQSIRDAALVRYDVGDSCGVCACCPCGDCDECREIAAWAAMDAAAIEALADVPAPGRIHGGRVPAVVTADMARARAIVTRNNARRAGQEVKRAAHRRHRGQWRAWCRTYDPDREPCPVPGTGRNVA